MVCATVARRRSSWTSWRPSRGPVSTGSQTSASELALVCIPVLLEIADQRRAEVAVGLLAGEGGHVLPEDVKRLLSDANRAAIGRGVDQARAGQRLGARVERLVHRVGLDDFVAEQLGWRDSGLELPAREDCLPGEPVADRARQAQRGGAGDDPLLAGRQEEAA